MPSSFGSLTGQVALITGGAGGLGRVAALWLAVAGAQVVVADVSAAALERAETWLSEKLPDATFPELSVAVQLTVVVPIAKVLPDAGTHASTGLGSRVSVAVAV